MNNLFACVFFCDGILILDHKNICNLNEYTRSVYKIIDTYGSNTSAQRQFGQYLASCE